MDAVALTAVPVSAAGTRAPPRCLRCNYDLHGLPADGNCPECGLSIARSSDAAGGELRHAPPGWLASLSWGSRLVLLTPVLGYVYAACVGLRLPWINSLVVFFGVRAALDVVFAAGIWLLTRPQPHRAVTHWTWRWALRLLALAPLADTVTVYLRMDVRRSVLWRDQPDWAMLGLVPMPALLFLHLRRLALRVPAARLAQHCAVVATLGSACFAGAGLSVFVRMRTDVELAFGVGCVLTLLWAAFVMAWFAVVVHRARRASVASWTG